MARVQPTEHYFQRFGYSGRQIQSPASADLGLVIVIPCFNEPELLQTLRALRQCDPPNCSVEVIVVINASAGCSPEIQEQNAQTLREASAWTCANSKKGLQWHLLYHPALPPKQAGVGLARKIGMDEALRRLDDVGAVESGIIAALDADCTCQPNYLTSLREHFDQFRDTPGCSIYFEHPLAGPFPSPIYEAIVLYELHLRYYVQALRMAGFPHAFHTVGSSMAVRAAAYRAQGGMNRRQAGEDFYFLQKIMALGGYTDLLTTMVTPSPRPSSRVPFGTGKAIRQMEERTSYPSYPLQAFLDLQRLFKEMPRLWDSTPKVLTEVVNALSESLRQFLDQQGFEEVLKQTRAHTASSATFRSRLFDWFNGFRVMKYVHHARDGCYGARPVEEEARALLALRNENASAHPNYSARELLVIYRDLDREGWRWPPPSTEGVALQ